MMAREAQRHNARRMTDVGLAHEYRLAALRPEQPPMRVAWLEVLREELARRGLKEPTL